MYHGPGLLNVSPLRNLRYLAVPVDALMELDPNHEVTEAFNGNRHGFGSVHDIGGMWAETITFYSDLAQRDGGEMAPAYVDDTRSIWAGPIVPLSNLLPDSLQHLRILDDANTESLANYVDERLHDFVLNPRFSELHDVQVRRTKFFTEHVRNLGWHIERRPFWNVMRRV